MNSVILDIQKRFASRAMILAIVIGLVLVLIGYGPWGRGLILGTIFSIINFVLLTQSLPKTIHATQKRASLLSLGSIGIRYIVLAIPIVAAFHFPRFEVFGVCVGLFMVQIVMLIQPLFDRFSRTSRTSER